MPHEPGEQKPQPAAAAPRQKAEAPLSPQWGSMEGAGDEALGGRCPPSPPPGGRGPPGPPLVGSKGGASPPLTANNGGSGGISSPRRGGWGAAPPSDLVTRLFHTSPLGGTGRLRPSGEGRRLRAAASVPPWLISALAAACGFLAGTVLIILVGRNPAGLYTAILQAVTGLSGRAGGELVWNPRYTGEWLVSSMPLILCGLSMGFAGRAGLFNIGAEGQYIAGLTAAQFAAIYGPQVPVLHWAVAVAAALTAGALWGGLAGYFKARLNVSEVVSTIMMNYLALFLSRYLTRLIPGTNTYQTPPLPETARLASPFLAGLTNQSRLGYGLFLTAAAVVFYGVVMNRTRLGYALRATGLNKEAARCAGIAVNASLTLAMAISGAFAGLAGAVVALGSFPAGRVLSGQDGFGFDGIAVALVGNSGAGGIAVAGLLFGMLKNAQPLMQTRSIPDEIASIISGVIVVFISLRAGVRLLMDRQMKAAARRAAEAGESPENGEGAV